MISPLLANIALHGLENRLLQYIETVDMKNNYGRQQSKRSKRTTLTVVRYADDFVILHKDKAVVQKCMQITAEWLNGIGLELKPEKTRFSHTLVEEGGNIGFDFLGFNIKQFKVGEYASKQGFKTIITPSKERLKVHTKKIGDLINKHKGSSREALIATLNPVIRGWSNYYKTVCSKNTFQLADHIIYQQIRGWAVYRHENAKKTWTTKGNNNWVFATKDGRHWLAKHGNTAITRHTKVKDTRSPYDGDWVYWSKRRGEYPETPKQLSELIKKQEGKCSHCGQYFTSDCLIEIHHIDKNRNNNKKTNLTAVHRHCHDIIHAMWEPKEWETRSDEPYL